MKFETATRGLELSGRDPISILERERRSPLFSLSGNGPVCHPHAGSVLPRWLLLSNHRGFFKVTSEPLTKPPGPLPRASIPSVKRGIPGRGGRSPPFQFAQNLPPPRLARARPFGDLVYGAAASNEFLCPVVPSIMCELTPAPGADNDAAVDELARRVQAALGPSGRVN